jgi:MFS transporter
VVPSLVTESALGSANGLIGFVRSCGGIAGPVVGGGLYASFGPAAVFGGDTATFFWAALLIFLPRPARLVCGRDGSPLRDIAEGARYMRGMPILMVSIPVAAVAMMISDAPTQTLLPRLVTEHFGGSAIALGAFRTALGIGFALGALLVARAAPGRRRALLIFGAWTAAHFVLRTRTGLGDRRSADAQPACRAQGPRSPVGFLPGWTANSPQRPRVACGQ